MADLAQQVADRVEELVKEHTDALPATAVRFRVSRPDPVTAEEVEGDEVIRWKDEDVEFSKGVKLYKSNYGFEVGDVLMAREDKDGWFVYDVLGEDGGDDNEDLDPIVGSAEALAGDGLTADGDTMNVGAGDDIEVDGDTVSVAATIARVVAVTAAINAEAALRLAGDAAEAGLRAAADAALQPLHARLTAFSGLAGGADLLPYMTGANTLATTGLSTYIRTLLDDASALVARTTLGIPGAGDGYVERALPTVVNDHIEVGYVQGTSPHCPAFDVGVAIGAGSFVTVKRYLVPGYYGGGVGMATSTWYKLIPVSQGGGFQASNDYDLEASVDPVTSRMYLRLRRTIGASAGTAKVKITMWGEDSDTFVAQTGTGTSAAPTLAVPSTVMETRQDGIVKIWGPTLANYGTLNAYGPNVLGCGSNFVGAGYLYSLLGAIMGYSSGDTYGGSTTPKAVSFINAAGVAWFTALRYITDTEVGPGTGIKASSHGYDFRGQIAGNAANAVASGDLVPKGQMDTALAGVGGVVPSVCEGRLTLLTGNAVPDADQIGISNLRFTPLDGNRISLYNGAAWVAHTFTERTLALAGLTSGKNYDVFLYDNAGTLTLELTAWNTDTARVTALVAQDGVLLKTGALTRRYLGTIRTTGTTTTEDSQAKRFVWNYRNRRARALKRVPSTANWTYQTNAWRQANADAANQVEVVLGVAEDAVDVTLVTTMQPGAACDAQTSIGLDSTAAPHADAASPYSNGYVETTASGLTIVPGIGYHRFTWLEKTPTVTAAGTFYGNHTSSANPIRSTLRGTVRA